MGFAGIVAEGVIRDGIALSGEVELRPRDQVKVEEGAVSLQK